MSSKNPAVRQRYREQRTKMIEEFAHKYGFDLKNMNQGYQLRLESVVDLYPTNGRLCWLPTKEWGEFDGEDDLKKELLERLSNHVREQNTGDNIEKTTKEIKPEKYDNREKKVYNPRLDNPERTNYFCIKHAFVGVMVDGKKYPTLGLGSDDMIYEYENGVWREV